MLRTAVAAAMLDGVARYLVTGNPGAGKSTVAAELARRGLLAFDADSVPGLAHWVGPDGRRAELSAPPDESWLRDHSWVWSRSRLLELMARGEDALFVCGIATNLSEMADLFDAVFLLQLDAVAQEARLDDYDRANPPGRTAAAREQVRRGLAAFQAAMIGSGATAVDATAPVKQVVDELLARARDVEGGPH